MQAYYTHDFERRAGYPVKSCVNCGQLDLGTEAEYAPCRGGEYFAAGLFSCALIVGAFGAILALILLAK